jgi:hypothetical protein
MPLNAAGLDVSGAKNPKWKGGLIAKSCEICGKHYQVKPVHSASRFCSLQCVGLSQRGKCNKQVEKLKRVELECEVCGVFCWIPASHVGRYHCCSKKCSYVRRSRLTKGSGNPSWAGGVSRLPYPWNFRNISRAIIKRDGERCWNPACSGADRRLTTHHINYEKSDCRPINLICLCSACNSKANFGRERWMQFYQSIMLNRHDYRRHS